MHRDQVELLELFQRAQAEVTDRVDAVEAGQWDAPALPGWTVVELVAQLVAGQLRVPLLLAGEPTDVVPTDTGELIGGDPLTAWESATDGALTAWAHPDALTGSVLLPTGPVPAAEHLAGLVVDLTVHAWDLARATGGDTRLDRDLVESALRFTEQRPGLVVPGAAGTPLTVPGDADPLTRLLARCGRRPPVAS